MNFETYAKLFRKKALNTGFSEDIIIKCLSYAELLYERKVPVIYNLTHLSRLIGIERNYLIQAAVVSKHSDAYYRYYKIKKKSGEGTREIKEPLPNLKLIQHWILDNILETVKPSSYAKAYVKKRGLNQNIRFHVNQRNVLSIDLKDFFPSINFQDVEKIFLDIGYSIEISKYLAKLCCLEEKLPQGAPTSPYISNLILKPMDNLIAEYCKSKEIRFTRYADDLTFSGDFDEKELLDFVYKTIKDSDFEVNDSKTKLMLKSQRQIVTGVIVNDKPQLDKDTRREIRKEVYYIKKFGLHGHLKKKGIANSFYLNGLIGKISFGLYLNPDDEKLKEYHSFLSEVFKRYN